MFIFSIRIVCFPNPDADQNSCQTELLFVFASGGTMTNERARKIESIHKYIEILDGFGRALYKMHRCACVCSFACDRVVWVVWHMDFCVLPIKTFHKYTHIDATILILLMCMWSCACAVIQNPTIPVQIFLMVTASSVSMSISCIYSYIYIKE